MYETVFPSPFVEETDQGFILCDLVKHLSAVTGQKIEGEVMSLWAFNKLLKDGLIKPGTVVDSPLHGKGNVSEDGQSILWGLP